jgi:hypothetical protein
MQFFIGKNVRIKTTLGKEIEGEIFAIDVEHSAAVMIRNPNTDKYHWLKTALVREIEPILTSIGKKGDPLYLPPLNWDDITQRERDAEEAERKRLDFK